MFNHDYSKLRGQRSGFLCYATIFHVGEKFPEEAYQYDTDGLWEFKPNTDYIQLVFLGDKEIPFTTYRNDNPVGIPDQLADGKRPDDEWYDLSGRRILGSPSHGIYIKGGRKFAFPVTQHRRGN